MVEELSTDEVNDMIKVNCGALVNMSRVMLPLFRHRGKGAAINVSSYSGLYPYPFGTVYGATKAFDVNFSRTCEREYNEYGIKVHCITPALIADTGLYANSTASLNAPRPEVIVRGALDNLGKGDISYPYWFHGVMGTLTAYTLEDPLIKPIVDAMPDAVRKMFRMIDIRKETRERARLRNPDDERLKWPLGTGYYAVDDALTLEDAHQPCTLRSRL